MSNEPMRRIHTSERPAVKQGKPMILSGSFLPDGILPAGRVGGAAPQTLLVALRTRVCLRFWTVALKRVRITGFFEKTKLATEVTFRPTERAVTVPAPWWERALWWLCMDVWP